MNFDKIIKEYRDFCLNNLAISEENKNIAEELLFKSSYNLSETNNGAILNVPFFNYKFEPSFYFKLGIFEDDKKIYLSDLGQVSTYFREEFNGNTCDFQDKIKAFLNEHGLYKKNFDYIKEFNVDISIINLAEQIHNFFQILLKLMHIDNYNNK